MMRRVWLDAGHGGEDPGAVAPDGTQEKDLNLVLVKEIEDSLIFNEDNFISAELSRGDDTRTPLGELCMRVNDEHAAWPISLVVSIHHNASNPKATDRDNCHGLEVYYVEGSRGGRNAAFTILDAVRDAHLFSRVAAHTTKDLGRRLSILHDTFPPAILIECGYLDNDIDLKNAKDSDFQHVLSKAIAVGILRFLNNK